MKISFEYPPIYEEANKAFKLTGREVFTYGDTIYNPSKVDIPDHLLIHEETHGRQHNHNEEVAIAWWCLYLADPQFRVNQEIEAYHEQYKFICTKIKDKNARFRNLHMLAQFMCSPMYGQCISYTDAIRRIRG